MCPVLKHVFRKAFPTFSDVRKERHAFPLEGENQNGGFTLVELIFVIAIIAVLVSMSSYSITSAREKAREVDCMSNLRNIGVAIVTYRGDHGGKNPGWISRLYPTYIDDLSVYVCRSDPHRGHGSVNDPNPSNGNKFENIADNDSRSQYRGGSEKWDRQNDDVKANSYFYEFSAADSDWSIPDPENPDSSKNAKWYEFKEYELLHGNGGKPHSSSRMPIVRCYHHSLRRKIDAYPEGSKDKDENGWEYTMPNDNSRMRSGMTLNVAYAGNVVIAPLWWQGAIHAGGKGK